MGTTNWCLGRRGLGSSGICPRHSDTGSPTSFLYPGTNGRLPLARCGVISLGCSVDGEPRVQVRCCFFQHFIRHFLSFILLLLIFWVPCAVKRLPKLKSRYKQCVEATIEYVKSIDDFKDLVDPRTLALYCLGLEPSTYVLRTIKREEKKSKYLVRHCPFFSFFFFFFKLINLFKCSFVNLYIFISVRDIYQIYQPNVIGPSPFLLVLVVQGLVAYMLEIYIFMLGFIVTQEVLHSHTIKMQPLRDSSVDVSRQD